MWNNLRSIWNKESEVKQTDNKNNLNKQIIKKVVMTNKKALPNWGHCWISRSKFSDHETNKQQNKQKHLKIWTILIHSNVADVSISSHMWGAVIGLCSKVSKWGQPGMELCNCMGPELSHAVGYFVRGWLNTMTHKECYRSTFGEYTAGMIIEATQMIFMNIYGYDLATNLISWKTTAIWYEAVE